jgi:PAS domain S-box-containing protein
VEQTRTGYALFRGLYGLAENTGNALPSRHDTQEGIGMAGRLRVLYVDDEPSLLEIGKLFLEADGEFVVDTLTSATEALSHLISERYDAIISDYQMPEMDGIAFLKHLKASGNQTPFIIFTGRSREEVVVEALNTGAAFYLQKGGDPGVQFTELSHKVRSAVEKRTTETAFIESEEKFRVLADTSPVGIAVLQGNHDVYINNYAARMSGYTKEELCSMNFWDMIHPDFQEMIRKRGFARQQGNDEPARYEVKYLTKSGESRWAHLSAGNIIYEGKPAVVVMLVDVTERKRAEEELQASYEDMAAAEEKLQRQYDSLRESQEQTRKSEQDYRSILENIQDVYYRSDAEGNLILASPSLASLLGYPSVQELYGKNIASTLYYVPEERKKVLANIHEHGSVTNHELIFRKRDGTPVIISTSSHEYFNADGKYLGVEGIFRDITDRKQAEEALKKSENMYRTIFETTGAATIIIEKDTTISLANSEFARMSGFSIEELEGKKSWTEFVVKEDHERLKKYHADRRQDPPSAPKVYEFRFVNRSGEIRYCFNHVALIPGTTRSVSSVVDITERVKAEQSLRESENQYRTIFNNTGAATIIIEKDTTISLANSEFARMSGFSIEELEGKKSWTEFVVKEDHERLKKYHADRRQDPPGAPKIYEFRFINRSGEIRHCFNHVALIPGTTRSVASVVDITERVKAEQSLRESENLYRTIFNNTGAATIIIAPDTTILLANDGWVNLTGIPRAEQEKKLSWTVFVDPVDLERMKQYHYARRSDPSIPPKAYEFTLIDAKKSSHRCFVYVDLIPGSQNSVASIVDITSRVLAEELYQTVFENTGTAMAVLEEDTTISHINEEMSRVWGYTREEVEGRVKWPQMVTDADRVKMQEFHNLRRTNPDAVPRQYEFGFIHKNGEVRQASLAVAMISGTKKSVISIRDITESAMREKALRESEEKFRALVEQSLDGIIITDFCGKLLFANRRTAEIVGYDPAIDLAGKVNVLDFITPEYRPLAIADFARVAAGTDSYLVHYKVLTLGKKEIWIDCIGKKITFTGVSAVLLSIRDVSSRKIMEDALRESEGMFRHLQEQLPDYVLIHEGETIRFVNTEGARLMGKTPAEIIGTSVLSYAAPEYHDLIRKNTRLRYEGVAVDPYEIEIIAPSGNRRRVVVRSARIASRNVPTTLAVLTDITEQKHAQDALKESERLYRTIIENMQDLFYRTDLQGNITMISPRGARLAGYESPEVLIGRNVARDLYADPMEREHLLAELNGNGEVSDYPVTLKAGDGTLRTATTSSHFYYDNEEKVQGIEGIIHDITAHKEVEKALIRANNQFRMLSSITRHDINNQLTAILGYLQLLQAEQPSVSDNRYFQKIFSAAQTISAMIEFTKVYNVGGDAPVWQGARTLVESAAEQAPIGPVQLHNDIRPGTEIFSDPIIFRVFYNLLENAARYGGKIRSIRFSDERMGESLIIVCEDDGEGIPADQKEKIFERGFGRNTGLGLALSREILSITGITIRETGEPGKGARFEMTVPKGAYRFSGS